MSKRFKAKDCVYRAASGASTTADHVFAREFVPIAHRMDLPIVPARLRCNHEKSTLEHYLATVLPFGARHATGAAMLTQTAPRRLARNGRLHTELAAGVVNLGGVDADPDLGRLGAPFDSDKLLSLFSYIARALTHHHWQIVIPVGHQLRTVFLNPHFETRMREMYGAITRPCSRRHRRGLFL